MTPPKEYRFSIQTEPLPKGLYFGKLDKSGSDFMKSAETTRVPLGNIGLCDSCRYTRRIESDRGSIFYLCERSATDASFPKYPRLPVLRCAGYESSEG